jgi:hypothetical protein
VLRGVLADLQQYFCELDLEFECCTLFESKLSLLIISICKFIHFCL